MRGACTETAISNLLCSALLCSAPRRLAADPQGINFRPGRNLAYTLPLSAPPLSKDVPGYGRARGLSPALEQILQRDTVGYHIGRPWAELGAPIAFGALISNDFSRPSADTGRGRASCRAYKAT